MEDHVRRGKADHKDQVSLLKVQGCHICLLSVEVNCVVPLHGRTAYDVAEVHLWLETGVSVMPQSHTCDCAICITNGKINAFQTFGIILQVLGDFCEKGLCAVATP